MKLHIQLLTLITLMFITACSDKETITPAEAPTDSPTADVIVSEQPSQYVAEASEATEQIVTSTKDTPVVKAPLTAAQRIQMEIVAEREARAAKVAARRAKEKAASDKRKADALAKKQARAKAKADIAARKEKERLAMVAKYDKEIVKYEAELNAAEAMKDPGTPTPNKRSVAIFNAKLRLGEAKSMRKRYTDKSRFGTTKKWSKGAFGVLGPQDTDDTGTAQN